MKYVAYLSLLSVKKLFCTFLLIKKAEKKEIERKIYIFLQKTTDCLR